MHVVDVSRREEVMAMAKEVRERHGPRCDLVFNNAGKVQWQAFEDMNEDLHEFDSIMGVNLTGVVNVAKAFLPMLKSCKRGACLVNISSMESYIAFPNSTAYVTSKAAVRGFSEALQLEASECYPHVRICCVMPGLIKTSLAQNSSEFVLPSSRRSDDGHGMDAKRLDATLKGMASTTPKECAEQIVRAVCGGGDTRIIIGTDARIFDYAVRLLPAFWTKSRTRWLVLTTPIFALTRLVGRRTVLALVLALCAVNAQRLERAFSRLRDALTRLGEALA